MKIGKRIERERLKAKMSQAMLGEAAGISQGRILEAMEWALSFISLEYPMRNGANTILCVRGSPGNIL